MLENNGLYITRKRKKWKFAHFDTWENCFAYERGADSQSVCMALSNYLPKNRPIVLEIAAGNAQFSLALANKHPEFNFIAIDIKSDRLYTSAKQAVTEGVDNIAFLRMHLNELLKVFSKGSVDTIWLTFPDPFPKKRSAKHRLTHSTFLEQYKTLLTKSGQLKFKTDNRDLFLWSLEQFVTERWHLTELSFDLHESSLPPEYKIMTHYEQRYASQAVPINFASLTY